MDYYARDQNGNAPSWSNYHRTALEISEDAAQKAAKRAQRKAERLNRAEGRDSKAAVEIKIE